MVKWPKWAEDYLAAKGRRSLSEKTIIQYEKMLRVIVDYGLDLSKCSMKEILAFLDWFRKERNAKPGYYYNMVNTVKMVLKQLKRRDINEEIELPKLPDREKSVKDKLLTRDEVEKLIKEAPGLSDRLIFELEDELGPRAGEILNLRIKDVQFDQYGAILSLTGKSGTRSRRVYGAVPDLRAYVNNHPQRNQPQAPLILNMWGTPYTYNGYYTRFIVLGKRILGRHLNPHMFRHTRATADSKFFTDRELMLLNGWKNHETVSVYSHLSGKDIEDKDLVLHGLKRREEILKPLASILVCEKCKAENAPIALYCHTCGGVLGHQETVKLTELEVQEVRVLLAKKK